MRGVTFISISVSDSGVISTHTPHARRDLRLQKQKENLTKFLLTRLMRGVTLLLMII